VLIAQSKAASLILVLAMSTSSAAEKLKIVVVGAGLGGLSAAISCSLAGHVVIVLEAAKELAEVI